MMLLRHCLDAERHTTAAEDDAMRQARAAEQARVVRGEPYRWPAVDRITHPARHTRAPIRRAYR